MAGHVVVLRTNDRRANPLGRGGGPAREAGLSVSVTA